MTTVGLHRVVYHQGAPVRSGTELSSPVVKILPCGDIVNVTESVIIANNITRLRLADGSGWTSLNATDGVPVLESFAGFYRVVYPQGAPVRSGPELSSPIEKTLPFGSTVEVLESVFIAENIVRFRLADGGGWTSWKDTAGTVVLESLSRAQPVAETSSPFWNSNAMNIPTVQAVAVPSTGIVIGSTPFQLQENLLPAENDTNENWSPAVYLIGCVCLLLPPLLIIIGGTLLGVSNSQEECPSGCDLQSCMSVDDADYPCTCPNTNPASCADEVPVDPGLGYAGIAILVFGIICFVTSCRLIFRNSRGQPT